MRKLLMPLIALGMLSIALLHVAQAQKPAETVNPPVEPTRNPFGKTVAGSGIVEAQTENIAVGSPLPGIVVEVRVKVGDKVKAGDPLFRLDPRSLEQELSVRQSMLRSAQMQLTRLENQPRKEEVAPSLARVKEAEVNMTDAQQLADRARSLASRGAIDEEERLRREQALNRAREQLSRAKAEYALLEAGAWKWDKEVSKAAVEQARAQVEQTRTELDRLTVRALVDGEVLQVNVHPGEYVATPSQTALVILGDVTRRHVRVDIDENDIPRFRNDLPARASLRGAPDREFKLRFVRVEPYVVPKKSLTGESTERVDTRVLQVIYQIDPASLTNGGTEPYVGQQLDVYIDAK